MTVATLQTAMFGADPFSVDTAGVLGGGVIIPQFRLGSLTWGDAESEFIYVKYTSASNLLLRPGLAFVVDDNFTATLLTTSNSPRGSKVVYSCIGLGGKQSFTTVTGTDYYLWMARSGQIPITYTAIATAGNLAETTATGGACNFPNSATVSSKLITGLYVTKGTAPATFTGTTVNTSTTVTVAAGQLTLESGPAFIGSTLSATGIASSQTITAMTYTGQNLITGFTISAAATASGTVTITPTLVIEGRVMWPYVDKTN